MTDGKLAVIGLGTIGSMALWQASRLSDSVVGFEAQVPAHGRSAVGGDTRLFRMINLNPGFYPILQRSQRLWAELEEESGQDILLRCGGLYIGTENGAVHPAVARVGAGDRRRPRDPVPGGDGRAVPAAQPASGRHRCVRSQRRRAADGSGRHGCGVRGPGQRRDRAQQHPVDGIRETEDGVVVTSGEKSWTFENVIVASGGWSRQAHAGVSAGAHPAEQGLPHVVRRERSRALLPGAVPYLRPALRRPLHVRCACGRRGHCQGDLELPPSADREPRRRSQGTHSEQRSPRRPRR